MKNVILWILVIASLCLSIISVTLIRDMQMRIPGDGDRGFRAIMITIPG
jgi:hypothetical protein